MSDEMSAPPAANAEFDLEGLRAQLDEQGLAVATAQEASVRSRKALADRTKGGCCGARAPRLLVACRLRGGWGWAGARGASAGLPALRAGWRTVDSDGGGDSAGCSK